jgi:anaphase-promoting complex subunit 11
VRVKRWHGVATWTWGAGSGEGDVCGICRCPYDGCPPDSRFPGDDAPAVWGACGHAFHLQCVQRWQEQQAAQGEPRCPLCRRAWEFRAA